LNDALIFSQWRPPLNSWAKQREDDVLKTLARYPRSFAANFALGYYLLTIIGDHPSAPPGSTGWPQRPDAHKLAQVDTAIAALKRATTLKPDSYQAWAELSLAYRMKWRMSESLDAAVTAYDLHPSPEMSGVVGRAAVDGETVLQFSKNPKLQTQIERARAKLAVFDGVTGQVRFPLPEIQSLLPHPGGKVAGPA
jgi:hypothetical protein